MYNLMSVRTPIFRKKCSITSIMLMLLVSCVLLLVISNVWTWTSSQVETISGQQVYEYDANIGRDESGSLVRPSKKPWYFLNGQEQPAITKLRLPLWPSEAPQEDRIVNQLMFKPLSANNGSLKRILYYNGLSMWKKLPSGQKAFLDASCPVTLCSLTEDQSEAAEVDAIFFQRNYFRPTHERHRKQIWILSFLESPFNIDLTIDPNVINWTVTYRHDSEIVVPYGKWVYYNPKIRQKKSEVNFAANKTKNVAWFVSNCHSHNSKRLEYARDLKKYIDVDIYGACGEKKCPRFRSGSFKMNEECFEMLNRDYRFYLSFENSNCREYITEKFFVNALGKNIIPIVMGAHPEDYAKAAPDHSYIHVDDFDSPKHLASYLHQLAENDDLYNEYFQWFDTGEFIDTRMLCRLCALLHDEHYPKKSYSNVANWWWKDGTCTNNSWKA